MEQHVVKFLQFLEAKEGKNAPLKTKLLTPDKFKVTKDDLNVKGALDLSNSNITSLPNGLQVDESLNLTNCTSLRTLANNLKVGWSLDLTNCTSLTSLPNGLRVDGYLNLSGCTSLTSLPNGLQVVNLDLRSCTSLKSLPNRLHVGLDLFLKNTPLAKMYTINEIRAMIEVSGGYVKRDIYI